MGERSDEGEIILEDEPPKKLHHIMNPPSPSRDATTGDDIRRIDSRKTTRLRTTPCFQIHLSDSRTEQLNDVFAKVSRRDPRREVILRDTELVVSHVASTKRQVTLSPNKKPLPNLISEEPCTLPT